MEILIAGHCVGTLQSLIQERRNELDALVITNKETPFPVEVEKLVKGFLWLRFDDVLQSRGHYVAVEPKQIEEGLAWAKGRERIVIACHAGISRSSGMAVLIAMQEYNDLDKAFSILDLKKHWPNTLVIKLGAEILKRPDLWLYFVNWTNKRTIEEPLPPLSDYPQEVEYLDL